MPVAVMARHSCLTVMVLATDHWHHRSVVEEIVLRACKRGLAGASVLQTIESFGPTSRIHETRALRLRDDRAVAVVIVDLASKIDSFVPELDELMTSGIATIETVEVLKYVGDRMPRVQEMSRGGRWG